MQNVPLQSNQGISLSGTYPARANSQSKIKFIMGGLLIAAAIIYLIVANTQNNAQFFLTINELMTSGTAYNGREVRVSGAVIGDSIQYDSQNLTLRFTVAHIPGDNKEIEKMGGLAAVLKASVTDPSLTRMQVLYNGVKPDLLRNEAQAIMTGKMGEDGVFRANELLLKCPTKYEEALPQQVDN
jgi:cytochrome c-type biogenesis protein CcmE